MQRSGSRICRPIWITACRLPATMRELTFSLAGTAGPDAHRSHRRDEIASRLSGLPLALLAGFSGGSFSMSRFLAVLVLYVISVLCGTVLAPLLLPLLPGRMFAVKGAIAGLACSLVCAPILGRFTHIGRVDSAALMLVMSTVSAFYAMNFTGSTPFTSPSGVRREMQRSLPVMASAAVAVIVLLVTEDIPAMRGFELSSGCCHP